MGEQRGIFIVILTKVNDGEVTFGRFYLAFVILWESILRPVVMRVLI